MIVSNKTKRKETFDELGTFLRFRLFGETGGGINNRGDGLLVAR